MATGDQNDLVTRLQGVLPPWFPDLTSAPILSTILAATADALSFCYAHLTFAALQTRLYTMTQGWLDFAAWDFFGNRFLRLVGEPDASWRARVIAEIRRARQTRLGIVGAVQTITGRTPILLEFWNTDDMASYNTGTSGYGVGKGYGSLQFPNAIFLQVFRAPNQGIPGISGYGAAAGGYSVSGSSAYVTLNLQVGQVTDADIYRVISQTVAAGITPWTALSN